MQLAHSYSSVKDFEGCGRRYHQVRILRRFKQGETEATLYGTAVHKAFEEFILHGTPLPADYARFTRFVQPLAALGGEVYCEHKFGVTVDFTPCDFFDQRVWFRGVPDFMRLNRATGVAHVADFKTGKSARFADTGQLELMAAMLMAHFPEINRVKGALLFVVADTIIRSEYDRSQLPNIWSRWAGRAGQVESALRNGVWNPAPSPLCKFCPVASDTCEYRR